jgi:hypothetical protein
MPVSLRRVRTALDPMPTRLGRMGPPLRPMAAAMRKDPAPLPYLQQALTIAKFEPGMYEVVGTHAPSA